MKVFLRKRRFMRTSFLLLSLVTVLSCTLSLPVLSKPTEPLQTAVSLADPSEVIC